ncbi:Wzy polymerase domain-containing protein [Acinetobacter junii]|uniref:Wzy polymerase domain-containing protein n=1 Tax=Acinetobacter junii TaxID=40215 RepID=UPI00403D820C
MLKKNFIVWGIGVSYFIGIFSIFHLRPSFLDLAIGLQMSVVLAFTLAIGFFIYKDRSLEFSVSTLAWVFLALLILIQPFINSITYSDSLLFPVVYCLELALITLIVKQIISNEKNGRILLCDNIAFFLLIGGVLTVIILYLQLFSVHLPFIADLGDNKPIGNIVQPNQTAFLLCLAIVASLYLNKTLIWYRKINFIILFFFAIGIALTASRGGLLIMLGIPFLYALVVNTTAKSRVFQCLLTTTVMFLGYAIGVYLFNGFVNEGNENAIVRAIGEAGRASNHERILEQNLAYNMFSSQPVIGYGWGNSLKGAFDYALQDNWFILAHHSHFFITQIAAELGLIGLCILIPLSWILYKNINFKMDIIQAFPFILVTIILVYSMSEFPLWYLRFSVIFAVAIGLIDPSQIKWKSHYNSLIGVICFGIGVGSIFYYKSYLNYNYYTELTYRDQLDTKQINKLEDVFGFLKYKEQLIYYSLHLDNHLIDQKISLGNRVLSGFPAFVFIEKQATYYALNGEKNKSLDLYKKSCIMDYGRNCFLIKQNLLVNVKNDPSHFSWIYNEFTKWENMNFRK